MNSFIETLNQLGGQFLSFVWPMLWQSSLLIVFVLALDFLLAQQIRASVRYALWLAVLVKLLLPPALALPTGAAWWLFPAKPPMKAPAIKNYVVTYDTAPPQVEIPAQTFVMPEPPAPKLNGAGWALLASAAVSAGLFIWLAFRWWQVSRTVRRASLSENILESLVEAQRSAGLRSATRLKISDDRMSPAVCGLFRPVILLPRALAEKLSPAQLRAVLLHELFHLRRRDVWVNCAQALLQIFCWWHPLLWVANARIRRLREEAVDDAVMLALRDDADGYAPTLLEVAKLAFHRPLMSLGLVGIMESRSALRQRIERLVDFRAPRKAGLTFASLCGIFAFSAVALPMGQGPAPAEKQSSLVALASTLPAVVQNTNSSSILITAFIYQMRAAEFDKIVSGLKFNQADSSGDPWWSAAPDKFRQLLEHLNSSGLEPITRPRIQTSGGMPAMMYVGNDTHGIEFDCTPFIADGRVDLTVLGKVFDAAGNAAVTNQFSAKTSVDNHGGFVIRTKNIGGSGESNVVVITGVEIVTNSPAGHFQQRLMLPAMTNSTGALDSEERFQERRLVRDGKLLFEMGRLDYAEIDLLQALKLDPGNDTAKYYLNVVRQAQISRDIVQHNTDSQVRTNRVEKEWILPKNSANPYATNALIYSGPGRKAIVDKLARIRLDSVSYNGLPLNEVLKQLSEQTKLRDPEHKGINFLINNNPDLPGKPVAAPTGLDLSGLSSLGIGNNAGQPPPQLDPNTGLPLPSNRDAAATVTNTNQQDVGSFRINIPGLTDARLAEVLDAIVLVADHPLKYSIQDFAIVFSSKSPETPPLFMRTFKLDTNVFFPYLQKHGLLTTNRFVPGIISYFSDLGVDLTSPPGKSVFFSYGKGMLFVKATESDLDMIEHAVAAISQTSPPIRLNNNSSPTGATTATGLLSDSNYRTALHALEQRTGVETLSEPEVTTSSGRGINRITMTNISVPLSKPDPAAAVKATKEKLDRIWLPRVSFDQLALDEVLRRLTDESRQRDPAKNGLQFRLAPDDAIITNIPTVTIPNLADVRLADVVDAVVLTADHEIRYQILADGSVVFSLKRNPEQLFMRTFHVDPNTFYGSLEKETNQGDHNNNQTGLAPNSKTTNASTPSALAKKFFTNLGVDLDKPPGKSVFFNETRGALFVKATKDDLDTIERAIQVLNQAPPQIHIKARFYEMSRDVAAEPPLFAGQFSNAVAGSGGSTIVSNPFPPGALPATNSIAAQTQFAGILTDPNFRVALQALQSRKDTECLGEPEVTTTSGRQTQMRVTDIKTVVTNLMVETYSVDAKRIIPQTKTVETGPVLDVLLYVLADGYTINLALIPSVTEFLGYDPSPTNNLDLTKSVPEKLPTILSRFGNFRTVATVNVWDNQTVVLGLDEDFRVNGKSVAKNPKTPVKKVFVFVTATIVDPAGNRVHADDELPFAQKGVPPQPPQPPQPK